MIAIACDFFSASLGISTSVRVLLPAPVSTGGGEVPRGSRRRYPVLYLLHGLLDDHTTWHRMTAIERYAEPLSLIVVMPAAQRSFYTDMAEGYRYWSYVSQELPALVEATFPAVATREGRFVAGLSMGGYGAFKLALTHPERYAAAASLSGVTDLVERIEAGDERWRAEMRRVFGPLHEVPGSRHDLFHLAEQVAMSSEPAPLLYQYCGTEDFLYKGNLHFRDHAESLGLPLTYEEGPGAHTWSYWDQQIERVLTWLPIPDPEG